MLWTIALIIFVLWLLGWVFFPIGGLIHLLLIVVIIIVVFNLLTGRRPLL